MSTGAKLIRIAEDSFVYMVPPYVTPDKALSLAKIFRDEFPGKKIIVCQGDEFIDLLGEYEIVKIGE